MENNTAKCWKCSGIIDPADNYCKHCGAGQGAKAPWYYRTWGAFIMLLVIGPFAVYFPIKSPVMSKTAKWVTGTIIVVLGGAMFYQIYAAIAAYTRMLNSLLGGELPF